MKLIDNEVLREAESEAKEALVKGFGGVEITFDPSFNVVCQWEVPAVSRGITQELRKYLRERMACHLIDAGRCADDPSRHSLHGRFRELQDLLDLFPE
jgi:hypothetical protein